MSRSPSRGPSAGSNPPAVLERRGQPAIAAPRDRRAPRGTAERSRTTGRLPVAPMTVAPTPAVPTLGAPIPAERMTAVAYPGSARRETQVERGVEAAPAARVGGTEAAGKPEAEAAPVGESTSGAERRLGVAESPGMGRRAAEPQVADAPRRRPADRPARPGTGHRGAVGQEWAAADNHWEETVAESGERSSGAGLSGAPVPAGWWRHRRAVPRTLNPRRPNLGMRAGRSWRRRMAGAWYRAA